MVNYYALEIIGKLYQVYLDIGTIVLLLQDRHKIGFISLKNISIVFYDRYNKLALDCVDHVDEVLSFQGVQTAPLHAITFSNVSMGTSHSATITSEFHVTSILYVIVITRSMLCIFMVFKCYIFVSDLYYLLARYHNFVVSKINIVVI